MQSLEKAVGPAPSGQGASYPLKPREAHLVQCFKRCLGLTLWKIDRNQNISVETRKGCLVSHLTSRSVFIILPNLV